MLFLIILLIVLNINHTIIFYNVSLDRKTELATNLPSFNLGGEVYIKNNSNNKIKSIQTINSLTTTTAFCNSFNNITLQDSVCYWPVDSNNCGLAKDDFISRIFQFSTSYTNIDYLETVKNYISCVLFILYLLLLFTSNLILSRSTKIYIGILLITALFMLTDRALMITILQKYMSYLQEIKNINLSPEFLYQTRNSTMILNLFYCALDIIINIAIFCCLFHGVKNNN